MNTLSENQKNEFLAKKRIAELRQDNKQHATKIDQGLRDIDFKSCPIRAIWELCQNARDLSTDSHIRIELYQDKFVFSHNGKPFDIDSLSSLIKQVSSQSKENEDTVGQYGTGFLATHYYGKKFYIYGSYKVDDTIFIKLDGFEIDRTYDSISELTDKIAQQIRNTDDLLKNGQLEDSPSEWTTFKYILPDKHLTEATRAIQDAINQMPYVMLFNDRITSCEIIDYINHIHSLFSRKRQSQENDLHILHIDKKESETSHEIKLYYLESEDGNNRIVLPLENTHKAKSLGNISKLFMHFPLLGTEDFGFEYIFHSHNFNPVEKRDGLYLPSENENNRKGESINVDIIKDMQNMLFSWLKTHIKNIENSYILANFDYTAKYYEYESTKLYMKEMQKEWSNFFYSLPMVLAVNEKVLSFNECDNLVAFDEELMKTIIKDENHKYYDVVYKYANLSGDYVLPSKNVCMQWSLLINKWNCDEICKHKIGYVKIVEQISLQSDDLYSFLLFLKENEKSSFFDQYKVIPNRKGNLELKLHLRKSKTITDDLYKLVDPIIPDEMRCLVDNQYSDICDFDTYEREQLKKDISNKIEDYRKKICESSKIVRCIDDELQIISPLVNFCSAFPSEADSVRKRLMPYLCQYYNMAYQIIIIPNMDDYDGDIYEKSFYFLVEYSLYKISNENKLWANEHLKLLSNILRELNTVTAFDEYKEKYGIFPNEYKVLCLPKELKKNNIDKDKSDKVLELYNHVLNEDIRQVIVLNGFECYYNFETIDAKELCRKIEDNLKDRKYEDKEIIIEIIELIDHDIDGYGKLFESITKEKSEIFFKCAVSGSSKNNVYKLMKQDEDTLEQLADIVEQPNFSELFNKAKQLLEQEKQEQIDFIYKRQLGEYVEQKLKDILKDKCSTIKCDIEDQQNGQDIVIYINETPKYYIEVKSRWSTDKSVLMSETQYKKSINNRDCYALCVADMTTYNRNLPAEIDIADFVSRLKFLVRIGDLNASLEYAVNIDNNTVHIASGYKVLVQQKLIQQEGCGFENFVNLLSKELLRNNDN